MCRNQKQDHYEERAHNWLWRLRRLGPSIPFQVQENAEGKPGHGFSDLDYQLQDADSIEIINSFLTFTTTYLH